MVGRLHRARAGDLVIRRVLERGWAHHIERLMVLGDALCLLRVDLEEVWRWFMVVFVDAHDWVMVSDVYAMSRVAAEAAITAKPYVSGSSYLRTMSDLPPGTVGPAFGEGDRRA
ncbi:hypothetical protein GCM10011509_06230 [Ornithinimicrobium pekingense]|uniref:Uncharacterized protein n=1 Tax=Ornithinimicrobium pekingense TaxID=384677 RepID=A0ABQ2F7R6_9MICO|nr:hypothetical protein GCM10011509_06230 [Ornithinimicrobium pekingense]